ncbi:hypothetical protein CG706_24825 [Escherichia coli]|nr:hypothetical protein CG706_24825 [Escherichia coli]
MPTLPVHQQRAGRQARGSSQLRPLPAALVHRRAHRVDDGDVLAPRGAQRSAAAGRFLGAWCGPCKMMAPQFQQAARSSNPGSGWQR